MGLAVALGVVGVACVCYGVAVMMLNSGTWFFAVWYALGAALLLAGVVVWTGVWRRVPVAILRLCGAVVVGVALVLVVTQGLAISGMWSAGEPDLDYIVVLGAQIYDDGSPSPSLRYRLDAAREYLDDNPRTKVVVSGGQGSNEPFPEADALAAYLVECGVEESRILRERTSENTRENVVSSMEVMRLDGGVSSAGSGSDGAVGGYGNGDDGDGDGAGSYAGDNGRNGVLGSDNDGWAGVRVGVVTNNFHVFRAVRIARKAGLADACGIAAYSTPLYLPNNMLREGMGIIKDALVGNI